MIESHHVFIKNFISITKNVIKSKNKLLLYNEHEFLNSLPILYILVFLYMYTYIIFNVYLFILTYIEFFVFGIYTKLSAITISTNFYIHICICVHTHILYIVTSIHTHLYIHIYCILSLRRKLMMMLPFCWWWSCDLRTQWYIDNMKWICFVANGILKVWSFFYL